MIIPTVITSGKFPLNFSGTFAEYYAAFRDRLSGYIPDNKVITGYNGRTPINVNLGPWIRPDPDYVGPNPPLEWWSYIDGAYSPSPKRVGDSNFYVEFQASPAVNRNLTVQDKSGTVALTYDLYVPQPTIILTGAAPRIDWTVSKTFIHRLTANTVYTMNPALGVPGQSILVTIQNNGTAFTAAFPVAVRWEGGTMPAVPAGSAGVNAAGIYELVNIAGIVCGTLLLSSVASPGTQVDIDPGETATTTYGPPGISFPAHNLP